jgi:hypothetical protein
MLLEAWISPTAHLYTAAPLPGEYMPAEALGICPKSLWLRTVPRGTIPCVRIGTRTLYDPCDLQDWIKSAKVRPVMSNFAEGSRS